MFFCAWFPPVCPLWQMVSFWLFLVFLLDICFTVDLLVYTPCRSFQLVSPNVYLSIACKSRFISKVQFINFPFPGLHLHCQVWQFCQALDSKQFLLRFSCKFHGFLLHFSPWPILRSCLYAVCQGSAKPPPLLAPLCVEGCPSSGHPCTFVQAARLICEGLFWALLCPVLCCLSLADSDLAIGCASTQRAEVAVPSSFPFFLGVNSVLSSFPDHSTCLSSLCCHLWTVLTVGALRILWLQFFFSF